MKNPTPNISIPVDLTNPGQFFACCGLLELADRLWPGAEGWFEGERFNLTGTGSVNAVLNKLTVAKALEVTTLASGIAVKPIIAPLAVYLCGEDKSPFILDFWMRLRADKGKVEAISNPPWNLWSGQQTPLRIWIALGGAVAQQVASAGGEIIESPFTLVQPLKGRFGFDAAAAWNALDMGFSPNDQGMPVESSPATELLAAIGLQRFRPFVGSRWEFVQFSTWTTAAAPPVAAALAGGMVACGGQKYQSRLITRGQYAALGIATLFTGESNDESQ